MRAFPALIVASLLTGCSTSQPAAVADITPAPGAAWRTAISTTTPTPAGAWWESFNDPTLTRLVAMAEQNNTDLAAAAARLQQARAATDAAGASLWPQLSLFGTATHTYLNGQTTAAQHTAATRRWQPTADATLSYEVDFFGRLRSTKEAARLTATQQQETLAALRLATAVQVASTYTSLLAANAEVSSLTQQQTMATHIADMTAQLVTAGLQAPAASATRQQAVAALAQQRATAEAQQATLADTLATLLGVSPVGFVAPSATTLPTSLPTLPEVLPGALLSHRPDVRAAEAALHAAGANVNAARAAWWPKVSLSVAEAASFNPAAWVTTLAGSLGMSVFDGGTTRATIRQMKGKQAEALATYRQTILTALGETNTALSNWEATRQALEAAHSNRQAAEIQAAAAAAQAKAGLTDTQTPLAATQALLQAKQAETQAELAHIKALLTAWRTLGGATLTTAH